MRFALHPIAEIYPAMGADELAAFEADIRANGVRTPIALWREREDDPWVIIDGRHRAEVCERLGLMPPYLYLPADVDPVGYVVSANSHRRHLTQGQLAMVAARLVKLQKENRALCNLRNRRLHKVQTLEDAAAQVGASKTSTNCAAQVINRSEDLARMVSEGSVALWDAEAVLYESDEVLAEALENLSVKPNTVNTLRRQVNDIKRDQRRTALRERPLDLPLTQFRTVIVDPPWPMTKILREVAPNQVGFDYPTMSVDEIKALPVRSLLSDDAFVFLWTTQKYLPSAFEVLQAWGVKYRFTMVWHKPGGFQPYNAPQFNGEFVLVGALGAPEFLDTKAFPTVFQAPRGRHSEKPQAFYDMLGRVSPGPHLDMFARQDRSSSGFVTWGEEANGSGQSGSGSNPLDACA